MDRFSNVRTANPSELQNDGIVIIVMNRLTCLLLSFSSHSDLLESFKVINDFE